MAQLVARWAYNSKVDSSILSTAINFYQNQGFIPRLKHRIYSWYVNSDFILLKFMCHRGSFREDIYKKCVLCKDADNGLEHVVNECAKLKNKENNY